jgi:hypothetical protein
VVSDGVLEAVEVGAAGRVVFEARIWEVERVRVEFIER